MQPVNPIVMFLVSTALASGCAAYAAVPDEPAQAFRLAQASASDDVSNNASDDLSDDEDLKIIALQGLMAAPPDRALPLVEKVLNGNDSLQVKRRALFVLGQIDRPRAQTLLLEMALNDSHPLQIEAIRTIGIGGNTESLAQLGELYRRGNEDVRDSVLNAYLIAGDPQPVFEIARDATDDEAFASAVRVLGAMGATEELRQLQQNGGNAKGLIHAFAIAGDLEGLKTLAAQTDDEDQRVQAIRSIGIVGGDEARSTLVDLYRTAGDESSKSAALQGLLISGHDEGVLALFRAASDPAEKRELLRTLVNMNSDLALEVIDKTLEGGS